MLRRDIDRGIPDPYIIVNIYDTDKDELVANLIEATHIPIPDIDEEVTLQTMDLGQEPDPENFGKYRITRREFEYTLGQPPENEIEEGDPDRLFAYVDLFAEPVED